MGVGVGELVQRPAVAAVPVAGAERQREGRVVGVEGTGDLVAVEEGPLVREAGGVVAAATLAIGPGQAEQPGGIRPDARMREEESHVLADRGRAAEIVVDRNAPRVLRAAVDHDQPGTFQPTVLDLGVAPGILARGRGRLVEDGHHQVVLVRIHARNEARDVRPVAVVADQAPAGIDVVGDLFAPDVVAVEQDRQGARALVPLVGEVPVEQGPEHPALLRDAPEVDSPGVPVAQGDAVDDVLGLLELEGRLELELDGFLQQEGLRVIGHEAAFLGGGGRRRGQGQGGGDQGVFQSVHLSLLSLYGCRRPGRPAARYPEQGGVRALAVVCRIPS